MDIRTTSDLRSLLHQTAAKLILGKVSADELNKVIELSQQVNESIEAKFRIKSRTLRRDTFTPTHSEVLKAAMWLEYSFDEESCIHATGKTSSECVAMAYQILQGDTEVERESFRPEISHIEHTELPVLKCIEELLSGGLTSRALELLRFHIKEEESEVESDKAFGRDDPEVSA